MSINFKYTTNTEITIDNEKHYVRMDNGMTGIGSRGYCIDDKKQFRNAVIQSQDITKDNHEVYSIKWRDNPWDKIDIIIHETEVPFLLSPENSWREPTKRYFSKL